MIYEDKELAETWEYLVEQGIATEDELQLVTDIDGYNIEALNSVIYARTGYHDLEQLKQYE